jgi:Protein of unknown function (DUF1059)
MKTLTCRDAGFDCGAVINGETEDEIIHRLESMLKMSLALLVLQLIKITISVNIGPVGSQIFLQTNGERYNKRYDVIKSIGTQ